MIYEVVTTKRFDKEVRQCVKRGYDMESLRVVIKTLADKGVLPKEYKPHKLKGDFEGTMECHVQPIWEMKVIEKYKFNS